MKKIITLILAIMMVMTLASCSKEEHSTVKRVTEGDTTVYVLEQTTKDGKLLNEKQYYITFETPEEAWAEVYG